MPCNGEKDNLQLFTETIDQLQEIIYTYQNTHEIILGGDLNESALVKTSSKRNVCLHKFMEENDLKTKKTECTFIHPNGKDTSTIDFFLFKNHMTDNIIHISRRDDYNGNVSDHYPVCLKMKAILTKKKTVKSTNKLKSKRINWKKVDITQYQSHISDKLSEARKDIICSDANKSAAAITSVMVESAKLCLPEVKTKSQKSKLKANSPKIQGAILDKKTAFFNWKKQGRPNDPTNYFLLEKKITTAELRRQIRIEIAKRKINEKSDITQARQSDNALFHRLIRKQRVQSHKAIDELTVGDKQYTDKMILTGFHEHFKSLASKKINNDHDKKYLEQIEMEVVNINEICLESAHNPTMVSCKEIRDAAKTLNRGKAADVYGVTAEHIYHGGQELLTAVQTLFNNILYDKDVPPAMKIGILNPIYKNKGSAKESQNYRGITITPALTRLLEAVIKARIKPTLLKSQNWYQRGFTENSSPMNCALMVEEFFRNNKDLNKPTYMAFMDAKAAFDVVVHPNLMRKLYKAGIGPTEWLVINSLHDNSVTSVKWKDEMSETYINEQGVRQGSVLSADLYKVYNNDSLDRIQHTGIGARIGDILIQAPACADDVTVLSDEPNELQFLVNICKDTSNLEGFALHDTKSVILRKDSVKHYPENESWKLGNKEMPVVDSTTHMGILRTSSNQELNVVEHNIQKARRTTYSLMGAGLHGENGLDPETSISLLNTYIFPVLLYGLEVIIPTGKALDILDKQYKRLLKQILSVPITVADPAIYILSGVLPVEALIHKRILSLFGNITRLPSESIEVRLAKRQLEIKTFKSNSWFIAVKKILIKYDLPLPEAVLDNPPSKNKWKKQYNSAINKHWSKKVISQAKLYSSLKFLSKRYIVGQCHTAIKPLPHSTRDINRIPVKNKILTGTYILQTNRAKFNQNEINPVCQLCWNADETIQHFLLDCSYLENVRKPIISVIKTQLGELQEVYSDVIRHSFLQLVIDCSVILEHCNKQTGKLVMDIIYQISYHSRRLVYALHAARYSKLELSSKSLRKTQRPT